PDRGGQLLTALRCGLAEGADEFTRYQIAEALSSTVYPKYKFSEYSRIFLEDEAFIAFYAQFMDSGNWRSFDRKYTLREMLKLVLHLDGDVVECGCFKGVSAYLMCVAMQGTPTVVHLFD